MSPPVKKYLKVYNALSAVAWAAVLVRLLVLYPLVGSEYISEGVTPLLKWVQSLALLEVFHSAFGLVRSSPLTALMQVASRLFLVWGVIVPFPLSAASRIYVSMVLAWCITEIIRYAYYWCQLSGQTPGWLEYFRYTFFIALYPIGAGSEAILAYRALPTAAFFHPYWALAMKAVLLIYPPAFYVLYSHMFKLRAKVLNGARTGEAKAAARKQQ